MWALATTVNHVCNAVRQGQQASESTAHRGPTASRIHSSASATVAGNCWASRLGLHSSGLVWLDIVEYSSSVETGSSP